MNSTVGRIVKITGVKRREDLSGAEGIVQEELLDGRLKVLPTSLPKTFISVCRENLLFMQPGKLQRIPLTRSRILLQGQM